MIKKYKYFKDRYGKRSKSRAWTKKIDETGNCLLDKIKHNYLVSEKYRKTCKYKNYDEDLLIPASVVTGCVSVSAISAFMYLLALRVLSIIKNISQL